MIPNVRQPSPHTPIRRTGATVSQTKDTFDGENVGLFAPDSLPSTSVPLPSRHSSSIIEATSTSLAFQTRSSLGSSHSDIFAIMMGQRLIQTLGVTIVLLFAASSATRLPPSVGEQYALLEKRKVQDSLPSSPLVKPSWMHMEKRADISAALSVLNSIVPGLNISSSTGEQSNSSASPANYSLAGIPLNNTASLNQTEIDRARNCPGIEFITTRGANDSFTDGYWLKEMARQVMSRLPEGTSRRTETRYDSNIGNDLQSQVKAALDGSWWVANYTTLLAQSCPNTTIIMMAYSLGAAANTVASTRPRFPLSRIKAAVYWGSPLRSPGRPQNRGTAKSALGQVALLGYRTPRGLEPVVRDYCVIKDVICTSWGTLGPHLSYANSTYQDETVDYLVQAALA